MKSKSSIVDFVRRRPGVAVAGVVIVLVVAVIYLFVSMATDMGENPTTTESGLRAVR